MMLVNRLLRHWFVLVPPLFYWLSLAPTIGFGDTAILVDAIQQHLVNSQVNNHPFTVMAGMLFSAILPFDELALRANFVSYFFGSLAIIAFYLTLYRETSSYLVAIAASALLMVSHSMWWHSTIIENYAASAFLTVVCLFLWCELRRSGREGILYLLCAVGGFSILNHVQMAFVCVGIGFTGVLFSVRAGSRRWRIIVNCGLSALAGLSPWLLLVFIDATQVGSLGLALNRAFLGNFSDTFFSGGLAQSLVDTLYTFWFQSPSGLILVLGLVGIWLSLKRKAKDPVAWGILTAFALNTLNFAFYATWDKFAFLLISFIILFFYAGVALSWLLEKLRTRAVAKGVLYGVLGLSVILPPFLYGQIATLAQNPDSVWYFRYNNRYSENLYFQSEYIVNPDKSHYREVENFAKLLFEKLPANATFLDDDSRTYYPLADYYQRYYHLRPDVSVVLVNSWGIANWGMGADKVTDLMTRAYLLNKPFFIASLQSPTGQFIREAKKSVPVEFEPYELGPGRWVYRLVMASESNMAQGDTVMALDSVYSPLVMDAPAGYIDLSLNHLRYFSTVEPSFQQMHEFDGEWQGGDQLFLNNGKSGGYIELGLQSSTGGKAIISFQFTAAPDFAVVEIEIGAIRRSVDLYAPTVLQKKVRLGEVQLEPGITVVIVRVKGKNPRSSGYKFALDGVSYQRVGE